MNRSILAHTISMLDRIYRMQPADAMRVAAYVRQYMGQLVDRGALDDDDYHAFAAVLRQWHEGYGLPWIADSGAAFHALFSDKE